MRARMHKRSTKKGTKKAQTKALGALAVHLLHERSPRGSLLLFPALPAPALLHNLRVRRRRRRAHRPHPLVVCDVQSGPD